MNIVLSGPSGSGKGTITEVLMKNRGYQKFTTCTTRKPREHEKNGFDYYFLTLDKFLEYLNNWLMHNVREYGGNYYGSFEKDIDNINASVPTIFQLTPDRAIEMKKHNPDTLLVLVLPPNVDELKKRRNDRSIKRIEDDIKNLKDAKSYDYVLINDDLNTAVNQLMYIIDEYCLQRFCPNRVDVEETIDLFIEQFENSKERSGVEKVFNKKIADSWDDKSRFVTYHGIKNPITNEVFTNIHNGMSIADIGCGTGKLISKIDSRIDNSSLFGLDISDDMVCHAQARIFTGKNDTLFINADFMNYDFTRQFDLIIFSYVLHHVKDPVLALKRARSLLTSDGKILFSVPGKNYLSEIFLPNDLNGRFSLEEMDKIVESAGLYPLSACRNNFLMTFNSYEMYIEYLKSIGTYQKINNYTNEKWGYDFNQQILMRFNDSKFITGEYLTYNCVDKSKILKRR